MNYKGKNSNIEKLIEQLKKEELTDSRETQETIMNDIKASMLGNSFKKGQFVGEIKNGLGEDIKKHPWQITIIERSWFYKFKLKMGQIMKSFFTKL